MRVHRLRIEAFGPFPGIVDLDVDALSAEGLFLIHGPTGSGKTSLLDAICFALYADVPGARSKKGLRSDHSPGDAVPRVTLELTVGGRRLRLTRSPGFDRPKKRGTGVTPVQASVSLEERLGSAWVVRSTRNDEVADLVKDVMGMGMAQFSSVVMLPQGDFATFLRASPDDRRAMLERLFDITEYRDIEDWLAQARRAAAVDLERAGTVLDGTIARVEDVLADAGLAAPAPVPESLADLPPESVSEQLALLLVALDARVSTTMATYDEAVGAEQLAGDLLDRGRVLAALRSRGELARQELAEVRVAGAEHEARVQTVAAAERAAGAQGHLSACSRNTSDLEVAREQVCSTQASLGALSVDVPADDQVAATVRALHDRDETVLALRQGAEAATARAVHVARLEARATALELEEHEGAVRLEQAEQVRQGLQAEVESLAADAAGVAERTLRLDAARDDVARLEVADTALAAVAALIPERDALRTIALDRRQDLLDLRQRRLDGMAGELARSLAAGEPCPVCGSAEHPEPARTAGPVGPEDLSEAEVRLEMAEQAHRALHDAVEAHRHRSETLRTTLHCTDRAVLAAAVLEAERSLVTARAAEAGHRVATGALAAQAEEVASIRRRRATVSALCESNSEQRALLGAEHVAATSHIEGLRARHASCPCGAGTPDAHTAVGGLLRELESRIEGLIAARRRSAEADDDLRAALDDAGFDDADHARALTLSPEVLARERDLVTAHRDRLAAARAVASDPGVRAALGGRAPDLAALGEAAQNAREQLLTARTAQDDAERTRRSLVRLLPLVAEHSATVVAAAVRDARVREVADTTGGIGVDNTLRMRLTSFVLAARLEKVASLANERLAVMGGGRFQLEHSDDLAARGARSGLGLRVLDQWTGRTRDTATLSGGESFMASLALALGLADAVREEAGGIDLGTLFVDEGFGTLDDDSLEQVVTVLDGLREGGRAVGVVSHVADLRARVTHQAVVTKGASGSTVEVRCGAGAEPAA